MNRSLCFLVVVAVRLFYCVIVMISASCNCQAQLMSIRIYTSKDGLPSTYVYTSYQDKHGYLWVGSPDGISRFDGKYFTSYGLSDGLPDIRTHRSFMDSHLRYWVATPRGVAEFRGDKFVTYPQSDSQNISWASNLFETKAGKIWSATGNGVYQFETNKWLKVNLFPGYENHACRDMVETSEGVYINYGNLLVLKKPGNIYKVIGPFRKIGYYYNQLTSFAGETLISTLDGLYEIVHEQLVKLPGKPGSLKGVFTFFRDSKKRLWIASDSIGIEYMMPGHTDRSINIIKPPLLVQHIQEDNQGNIWIASGPGLIRISDVCFQWYPMPRLTDKEMLFNIFQPPSGPLLFNNGSFNLQAFEHGLFTNRLVKMSGDTYHKELIIDHYAFDDKNRGWYCLRGWELVMREGSNLHLQTSKIAPLGDEVFDVLFDDYRKKILVAIRTQKFPCQYNDTVYKSMPVANNIDVNGNIIRLHQCKNGVVLFGTDQGLIYSIDKNNICKLQLSEFEARGSISKFLNDRSGDVWIIYRGRGLRRYSWQADSLVFKEKLTRENGLTTDNANSMCFDNNNNLWVCTNSNVAVFSRKTNSANTNYQVASFFDGDDIKMGDAFDTRITKDKEGNIWLFSRTNIVCFNTGKMNLNSPPPSMQIERLKLNFEETNWANYADSLVGIFQLPYNLSLSHENNALGIYFKGVSTSGTESIKYSYLLEGLHKSWTVPSAINFVSFVSLPAGQYTFKVKAQLRNSKWSEPATFSFVIDKAFWQTWWFYTLTALAIMAAVYALFRYRLQQKIKLFEMRNRISRDLHDEIGSSISGINLLSQVAADKLNDNKPAEASQYLFKVKNYTQDVIEKLSDMVWVFNPQNDSIEKLLQRLNSFAISIALSKNIKMHFDTDKESEILNLTIEQRKAIYLVSKEAINNSFKYAQCNNIFYSLHARSAKWQLKIRDDGQGFVPAEKDGGNGLRNMQARADEIGANFSIQSRPGGGTLIALEF